MALAAGAVAVARRAPAIGSALVASRAQLPELRRAALREIYFTLAFGDRELRAAIGKWQEDNEGRNKLLGALGLGIGLVGWMTGTKAIAGVIGALVASLKVVDLPPSIRALAADFERKATAALEKAKAWGVDGWSLDQISVEIHRLGG